MVGLIDIAPVTSSLVIRGNKIVVTGVSARGVAHLLARFPQLRALMTGRDVALDEIIRLGGDVVAAMIAAGIGKPGDESQEAAVDNLSLEEQADLLFAIIRLTIPNGVGPLVDKLSSLGMSPGAGGDTATPASRSRKP